MELAQLLGPNGLYHKVWLAAHWDRKLKKQDYIEINLMRIITSILENEQIVSLRTAGHLLFGICKVFQKKFSTFEENAKELNTRLLMAFTTERSHKADPRVGMSLLQKVDLNELPQPVESEEQVLQAGQKTVARLEDITLRPVLAPDEDSSCLRNLDLLGELSSAAQQAIQALCLQLPRRAADLAPDGLFDSQPLDLDFVNEEVFAASTPPASPQAADSAGMLDIDAPDEVCVPLHEEGGFLSSDVGGIPPEEEEKQTADADGTDDLIEEPQVKKRRKAWKYDEETRISKADYQRYVGDRAKITQPSTLNPAIVLPHVVPLMPDFMTTFTDLCPALADLINNGCKEGERHFQTLVSLERKGHLPKVANPAPEDDSDSEAAAPSKAAPGPNSAPESLLADSSIGSGGLRNAEHRAPAEGSLPLSEATAASARAPPTEESLLRRAPPDMSSVLVPRPIDEDANFDARRWTGYSQRSEKMHSFLAKEFSESGARELTFEKLCESHSDGRRHAIAGCFFELLVLKTNGVIELEQEDPDANITISKATQWSSSRGRRVN
mmetsp:Transcript_142202/g.247873  ORF Transcript_142202/g.247873 Transcript_142202/m.247873 type:complete len:554 (-) Transcript_142202:8-1669(-)